MKKQIKNEKVSLSKRLFATAIPQGFDFKPTREVYRKVGINPYRFAKIYRGEIEPTIVEFISISDYFKVDLSKFFQTNSN